MLSQSKSRPTNRVQAIKTKFENLNCDSSNPQLSKHSAHSYDNTCNTDKENINNDGLIEERLDYAESSNSNCSVNPNSSYLYHSNVQKSSIELKKPLARQYSDPGKKLHRRHAFRCDRSKVMGPKRHGSCNGRSETSDFTMKPIKKLSRDRLERLGNVIENQMKKENFSNKEQDNIVGQIVDLTVGNQSFVFSNKELRDIVNDAITVDVTERNVPFNSIPDSEVPAHILEQYAKVIKPRALDNEKKDVLSDSGVSSETENLDDDKSSKIKQIIGQFEKTDDTNLDEMNVLCASSETMRLERKNPHLVLTSTLKKALKQPLPPGPPPKKPPRVFAGPPTSESPVTQKKDTRRMLEKLERVLQKREAGKSSQNNYDIAEENESMSFEEKSEKSVQPKEMHYLCTEILDIANKTLPLPPNPLNCFKSLNCAVANHSTLSLPYSHLNSQRQSSQLCSCSSDSLAPYPDRLSTFLDHKCVKCQSNSQKETEFKCHLKCKCSGELSQFFVDNEHIYDEPFTSEYGVTLRRSHYGTLNHSKSLEDLRTNIDDQKIYDIPCEISRPATPDDSEPLNQNGLNNYDSAEENLSTVQSEGSRTSLNLNLKKPECPNSPEPEATISPLNHLKSIFENIEAPKTQDSSSKKELDLKLNFEKLRKNFEGEAECSNRKSFRNVKLKKDGEVLSLNKEEVAIDGSTASSTKPPMKPKPMFVKKNSKSTENLVESKAYTEMGTKYSTERKYRKERDSKPGRLSLPERDAQLDQDKENLNRLMNELYETVVACSMQPAPPFPLSSSSEESVKLSRSLTEKRKNYVRRVSSRVAYTDAKTARKQRHQTSICVYKPDGDSVNHYSTFRSWKSFRTSQSNIVKMEGDYTDSNTDLDSADNKSIDEKAGCVDVAPPLPRERGLFSLCLLAALDRVTGTGHVRFGFPKQVKVPEHISNLMFPETLGDDLDPATAHSALSQCYSMVLTDERGERSYGYCRRVVPEGASVCLPLCYCLITRFRAPGFYYKVLEEIESHHGSSEAEVNSILQQLFDTDFPSPGEEIKVTYTQPETAWRLSTGYYENSIQNPQNTDQSETAKFLGRNPQNPDSSDSQKCTNFGRNSNSFDKCKTLPNMRRSDASDVSDSDYKSDSLHFYDLENNNGGRILLNIEGPKVKYIKRPLDPRVDESGLSTLVDTLGVGLTVKVFGSLLLERKVIICGDDLGRVSQCMTAVQLILYPLVWQQPLISLVPRELRAGVLGAPLPLLAGVLCAAPPPAQDIEGMLIDLTQPSKVACCQGDEASILPAHSYRALKAALQMECRKDAHDGTRNVMISEAFLRFFVDIFGDFWKYFSLGEPKEAHFGNTGVIFDTENFIKNSPSKQNQYFLEWFTETAIFNHFVRNMSVLYRKSIGADRQSTDDVQLDLIDAPLPDFYDFFEDRVRTRSKMDADKFDKTNYKSAMNKRMKLLKARLKELVA